MYNKQEMLNTNEREILKTFIEIDPGENFRSIRETLTRMGVPSGKEQKLFQSCHILHKKGKFYIVHFKEMYILDGKPSNFDEMDKLRRNKIASLIEEWGLCKVLDKSKIADKCASNALVVIPYSEKINWILVPKYSIGKKKHYNHNAE